jgi:hypothetical protein
VVVTGLQMVRVLFISTVLRTKIKKRSLRNHSLLGRLAP